MSTAGPGSPSGADLVGLGAMAAGAVIVPLVAGLALDGVLRTGPIFLVVGLALGIAAGGAAVYMRFRRYL